jgi:predicted metal-binding membrane protein
LRSISISGVDAARYKLFSAGLTMATSHYASNRAAVLVGLVGLTALSWVYLLYQDWAMGHMEIAPMAMPNLDAWGPWDLAIVFLMWAIMMVGMMLPSVTPMVLLYAAVSGERREQGRPKAATWIFVSGYLVAWTLFSVFATLAQWLLHSAAHLSPFMDSTGPVLGGAMLIAAGIYQWTPLKRACLTHCRSPLAFLLTKWRDGARGALAMGLRHGLFCTGCCWLLMAILFVVGVMNVMWLALLSVFVLMEKTLPHGDWFGRAAGLVLIGWGAWMALGAAA